MSLALKILGGVLLALTALLVFAVLKQSAKDTKLSGTITGGADTFFGQNKSANKDVLWSRVTIVTSIVYAVLVVVMYALA